MSQKLNKSSQKRLLKKFAGRVVEESFVMGQQTGKRQKAKTGQIFIVAKG